ncbi:MAG: bifunctional diguanylate cyclase/phosphodiesterase, partial [Pseudomonadales bacterium]|nr:bifunctional diguanylate cyclase/phosphodiesterase [Pseudomonadales bacterium]
PINTENAATRLKLYSPIGDEVGYLTWHPPSTASQLSGLLMISLTTTALLIALVYMLFRIFNKKIGKMHYELADALIKQKHLRTNLTLQSKLAGNESPDNVIEHLADILESSIPKSRCVTYLLDNVTHRITKIAAPSLDEGFIQSLKTIRTDQDDDSLTLFNGTSWTIPSLYSDPHRKYLNQFDVSFLKSAWSESMVSEKGERFGGVIIYREVEGQPEEHYRNLVKSNIAIAASNMAFCLNNQRMEQLAYYDPVTNLVNRHLFRILLERAIQHRKRHSFSIAILHIDIDHFKHLNNTLGHDIADQILVQLADRIAGCVRQSDIVARISGDEFAILIQVEQINIGLDKVAEKVLNTLRVPIEIRGKTIRVSASIGIAVDEKAQLTANELLHRSDEALRTAKESGRDQYCYYDAQLEEASQSKRLIEKELVNAISNSEFRLVYQPKIDMIKGTVNGLEALIRWRSTKLGDISPDVFIPIAEQNGQISSISDFVMEEACTKLAELQSHGFKHINMAVNLSARQFKDRELVDKLRSVIKRHRLKPSHLELELTETMIMEDKERARTTLRKLQEAGLKLAIDDFGTGYSSLSYLQYFRVDKLKVDRSFVMNIPDNSNDMELTAAIIALAHKLNLQVVAEGVETEAQSGFLNENNCDEAQGYFFCKPIESDDLIDVLLKMEKQYPLENKISN